MAGYEDYRSGSAWMLHRINVISRVAQQHKATTGRAWKGTPSRAEAQRRVHLSFQATSIRTSDILCQASLQRDALHCVTPSASSVSLPQTLPCPPIPALTLTRCSRQRCHPRRHILLHPPGLILNWSPAAMQLCPPFPPANKAL